MRRHFENAARLRTAAIYGSMGLAVFLGGNVISDRDDDGESKPAVAAQIGGGVLMMAAVLNLKKNTEAMLQSEPETMRAAPSIELPILQHDIDSGAIRTLLHERIPASEVQLFDAGIIGPLIRRTFMESIDSFPRPLSQRQVARELQADISDLVVAIFEVEDDPVAAQTLDIGVRHLGVFLDYVAPIQAAEQNSTPTPDDWYSFITSEAVHYALTELNETFREPDQ